MKTKVWILLLAALLAVCVLLSLWLLRPAEAESVRVLSEGELLYTLPLSEDTQITVTTDRGTNVITVRDGKVAVTEADCPDGHCKNRGFCAGGAHIVCLPNRLVLEFTGKQTVDGVAG